MKSLLTPRIFVMAAENSDGQRSKIIFNKTAYIYTDVHIRHGSTLMIRNLKWLVTEQLVATPLLGLLVLDALDLNPRDLLAAAADRFSGSIDAERLVGTFAEDGNGRISRVIEGFFHAEGDDQQDDDDTKGEWYDIGGKT